MNKINKNIISIVVPIFNVEKYLYKCLNSISNQTIKDINVFMIDDGSEDGSSLIAREYSLIDERFVYVKQKNLGLGGARNTGIALSQSNFITFVDSDDYISENYCEKLLQPFLEDELIDITSGRFVNVTANGDENSKQSNFLKDIKINEYNSNHSRISSSSSWCGLFPNKKWKD
jgi:glycosyltransferase involved in cell wall biosynthesis